MIQTTDRISVHPIDGMQMGGDHMIAGAAWVSTTGDKALERINDPQSDTDLGRLINYLMKNRHGSPFEHGAITFRVHGPLFMIIEWLRHRIAWSPNGESARYTTIEPVFYVPPFNRPMIKVDGWKAGKPKFITIEEHLSLPTDSDMFYRRLVEKSTSVFDHAYDTYTDFLGEGIDPGLARLVLPVGMMTSYWFTTNPRAIMAFLSLRTHEPEATFPSHPLWEIDFAARVVEEVFASFWPLTHEAFNKNGRVCP